MKEIIEVGKFKAENCLGTYSLTFRCTELLNMNKKYTTIGEGFEYAFTLETSELPDLIQLINECKKELEK